MYSLSTFYKSKEWENFREYIIHKRTADDGFIYDEVTGKPILKKYDIILHHKIVLTEQNVNDASISMNEENIMIVSHKTHNMIHERFGYAGTRHIYLVYGSPCSGKTTYVEDAAGKDDLILDVDKIYQAISINPSHIKSKCLSSNVFQIRDLILDMIKTRNGKWKNAYVVGGYPYQNERERLINSLGAEEIFIDTSIDKCLENASERPKEYIKYIYDWFELKN